MPASTPTEKGEGFALRDTEGGLDPTANGGEETRGSGGCRGVDGVTVFGGVGGEEGVTARPVGRGTAGRERAGETAVLLERKNEKRIMLRCRREM